MRVARFELVRPLKHGHITADQLAESSWETVDPTEFRRHWQAEVDDAATNHKRERLHLATGLLLPVWDKLPSDYVRVSRISARDGRSLLGREVPLHCVPELCQALGLEDEHAFSAEQIGLVQGTWVLHRDHTLSNAAFRPDDERSGGLGAACRPNLTHLAKWHSK